jgi:hypothetical protein
MTITVVGAYEYAPQNIWPWSRSVARGRKVVGAIKLTIVISDDLNDNLHAHQN